METTILLRDYSRQVEQTDKLPLHDLYPVLYGLFGEVGSITAAAKKYYRENEAYTGYAAALEEEFGDTIWYLAALCRRLNIDIDSIFDNAVNANDVAIAATDLDSGPVASVVIISINADLKTWLLPLGAATANLYSLASDTSDALGKLRTFASLYVNSLRSAKLSFARVLRANIDKVLGRFAPLDKAKLPTFDLAFPNDEQLPECFEIHIVQRTNGKSYLQWNGVFLGDPLTDNIVDRDGYRFHDVFHFAHAAVLHWSPVFRALIKHKRKSDPPVDEAQDGGRAIVVEEGLTAWIFSRAKLLDLFKDQHSLSFDLLKTIKEFVTGYEVAECPLKLWEDAILQGYDVFRQVLNAQGGIVIGNRLKRSLVYKPLP